VSDELRGVLAKALATMGLVLWVGCFVRWGVWKDHQKLSSSPHPDVLWTLGFLGLAFLAGAASLMFRPWWEGTGSKAPEPTEPPEPPGGDD
jgi:hypothetical protein